jgi:Flp pilus assembly protein TadD
MIGLIVMACQAASRLRWSSGLVSLLVAVFMVFGGLCYQRNQMWGQPEKVWASAAEDSIRSGRPYLGLVESFIAENRCADAIPYLEQAERRIPNDFAIQVAWGKALECLGKREDALQRLERGAAILPNSFVYQLIGLLYGEMGKKEAAGTALRKATELGPGNASAHSALGLWYEAMDNAAEAEREYRKALSIFGYNTEALTGLARIENVSAAGRQ